MSEKTKHATPPPLTTVEHAQSLPENDIHDLCDATDAAINDGGGFGWLQLPARDILERYWKGVMAMPSRVLLVARLDSAVCGTAQLIFPPNNNEAQKFTSQLTTHFVAPWARGHGLARMLLEKAEDIAHKNDCSVINLDVRETQDAAIALYEQCGYTRFGTHPFYAKVDNKIVRGHHYYKVIDEKFFEQEV